MQEAWTGQVTAAHGSNVGALGSGTGLLVQPGRSRTARASASARAVFGKDETRIRATAGSPDGSRDRIREQAFRSPCRGVAVNERSFYFLAMVTRGEQTRDAILDKALELDPKNGRAYFELGLLYNKQGKQGDAEQALSKAVQRSPNE